MKHINKFETTEAYNIAKKELNAKKHYVALTKDTKMVHLKPLPKKYILTYEVTQQLINDVQSEYNNELPLITRCDLFKSIKIDGEEIDLSSKIRTPYVFNYEYGVTKQTVKNIVLNYNNTFNQQYVISKHFDEPTNGIIEVEWNNDVIDLNGAFFDCFTLKTTPKNFFDNIIPNNLCYLFYNCSLLTETDVSNLNTESVSYMNDMFFNCSSLKAIEISDWQTNNVIEMNDSSMMPYESGMFCNCSELTTLGENNGLNLLNGNITNMKCMFYNCKKLLNLNTSIWNVSNVTNMYSLFENCNSLNDIDVSKWNVSNVTNMYRLFGSCKSIVNLEVSEWNVSHVTDMVGIFYTCSSLQNLGKTNVSNWDTSNVTDFTMIFGNDENLLELDVSKWKTSNVQDFYGTFYLLEQIKELDVSKWDTSKSTSLNMMFERCRILTSLGDGSLKLWNTDNVTDMSYCFAYLTSSELDILDVSNFNTNNVTDMTAMFRQVKASILDMSNWATEKLSLITNDKMSSMFYHLDVEKIRCKQEIKDWIISNAQYNNIPNSYQTNDDKWEIIG